MRAREITLALFLKGEYLEVVFCIYWYKIIALIPQHKKYEKNEILWKEKRKKYEKKKIFRKKYVNYRGGGSTKNFMIILMYDF